MHGRLQTPQDLHVVTFLEPAAGTVGVGGIVISCHGGRINGFPQKSRVEGLIWGILVDGPCQSVAFAGQDLLSRWRWDIDLRVLESKALKISTSKKSRFTWLKTPQGSPSADQLSSVPQSLSQRTSFLALSQNLSFIIRLGSVGTHCVNKFCCLGLLFSLVLEQRKLASSPYCAGAAGLGKNMGAQDRGL
jgi:hypothetical protein